MPRRIVSSIVVLSLLWTSMWAAAPVAAQQAPRSPRAEIEAYVTETLALAEALRGAVDRSQFDLDALLDRLEYDPRAIVGFVRDEIAFEQYPGLLRGAAGTLMSRAGNSLDQAVLLATLLRDAGLDARIARGRLAPEQARRLLERMSVARREPPAPADVQRLREIAERYDDGVLLELASGTIGVPGEAETIHRAATELQKLIADDGRGSGSDLSRGMIEEARDYFWVEHRAGPGGSWTAEHPAFGDAPLELGALAASEVWNEAVPAELQHRFRLAVFVEMRRGDRLEVRQVVPDWERPAANLIGRSFSVANYPNGIDDDLFTVDLPEAIAASDFFVPTLNGDLLPGTEGFDLDGVPFDLTSQGLDGIGATPLFRTVGQKADRAAAALGALGGSGDAPERTRDLTAQWIEYTLIAPDGTEKTMRRHVLDRVGAAVRASGDLSGVRLERAEPWQLVGSDTFMVAPGGVPASLLLDEYANALSAQAQLLRDRERRGELTVKRLREVASEARGPDAISLLALVRSFDVGLAERPGGSATYRSEPTIAALHWSFEKADRVRFSSDIVSNARRSRSWTDPIAARSDLLLQGVWETYAERAVVAWGGPLSGGRLETPFVLFEEANGAPDRLRLLAQRSALEELDLAADQKALIAARLDAGERVVVADSPAELPVWWTLDLDTGASLGFLPDGRGATATEYLIVGGLIAMVATLAIRAVGRCLDLYWQEVELCTRSAVNVLTGDVADARVNHEQGDCMLSQMRPWNDLPEPDCFCGGLNEPTCPGWLPPKRDRDGRDVPRGPRNWF